MLKQVDYGTGVRQRKASSVIMLLVRFSLLSQVEYFSALEMLNVSNEQPPFLPSNIKWALIVSKHDTS